MPEKMPAGWCISVIFDKKAHPGGLKQSWFVAVSDKSDAENNLINKLSETHHDVEIEGSYEIQQAELDLYSVPAGGFFRFVP